MDEKQIVTLVVAGAVALVWAVLEFKRWKNDRRERKAEEEKRKIEEENGLAPNPTRCTDHESRIRKVEASCLYMSPQIAAIEKDVDEIKTDVKTLIDLHLKQ